MFGQQQQQPATQTSFGGFGAQPAQATSSLFGAPAASTAFGAAPAASTGFGPLVRYISGDNLPGRRMAMTSPVLQESAHSERHVISFVLPHDVSVDDIPRPRDSRVTTVAVPARDMAARTYIGRWTQRKFEANAADLIAALTRDGISAVGLPSWARYDPPWTPPFLRRNEVLVEVSGA